MPLIVDGFGVLLRRSCRRCNNGKGRIKIEIRERARKNGKGRVETCSAMQRCTRRSVSTIGGAVPDTIIGRVRGSCVSVSREACPDQSDGIGGISWSNQGLVRRDEPRPPVQR